MYELFVLLFFMLQMLEIYKNTGVYWFTGQRDAALFTSKEPGQLISKLVDVFFTKDIQQQSSARGSGKHDALCPTTLNECLSKSICFCKIKKNS